MSISETGSDCRSCTANTRAAISLASPMISIFILFTSL
nr:MAG TPA: hypothetical protein [Caudoviricetes sp.]